MLFWTLIIFIILFSVLFVLYPVTKSIAQASFCGNFIGKIFLPMLTVRPMQDDQCQQLAARWLHCPPSAVACVLPVARSADAILPPLVFTPMMLFLSLARA